MNTTMEAVFHRHLKDVAGKVNQGRIMGAFRDAYAEFTAQGRMVPYSALCYGAKFKYAEADSAVWVKVGHNEVAAWDSGLVSSRWVGQSLCLFCDDDNFDREVWLAADAQPSQHLEELGKALDRERQRKAPEDPAAGIWRDGPPTSPWDSEWFLAEMIGGGYVVLKPLPEEYSYDFTTLDATYFTRERIKRWAQLSTSSYTEPDGQEHGNGN